MFGCSPFLDEPDAFLTTECCIHQINVVWPNYIKFDVVFTTLSYLLHLVVLWLKGDWLQLRVLGSELDSQALLHLIFVNSTTFWEVDITS